MSIIDLPELRELLTEVASLRTEVAELRALVQPTHEWWSLRQCAAAKRGYEMVRGDKGAMVELESFYSTLRARRSLQPPGEPREVGGRLCWHRSVVLPWLAMDDAAAIEARETANRQRKTGRRTA